MRKPFFLLAFWVAVAAQAQNPVTPALLSTRLFNARDGLPDNKVSQLLETRKSPFLWAVTTNELCRFDGYQFSTVWEKLPDVGGMAENSRRTPKTAFRFTNAIQSPSANSAGYSKRPKANTARKTSANKFVWITW